MRIAFFNIPAHGHTNPTLGVVRALTAQGHEVIYFSYLAFKEKIEAAGARFISCEQDGAAPVTEKEGTKLGNDLALSVRVLVDTTLSLDSFVCEQIKTFQPDCIVADSMAFWGKAAALKMGVPFVSSTTTFAFNRYASAIMRKKSLKELFALLAAMPKANRQIRRLKDAGYPVKGVLDLIASDDNTSTIVYTSPEFQPCSETFPDTFAFVGPSIRPVSAPFEKTNKRLVYISLGTVNNEQLPFYRMCLEELRGLDAQVVLSVGPKIDIAALGVLPENVCAYASVDQIAVLRQADAFVSHCGMNSVNESLYFGVPLIMVPQTQEQYGVANRTQQVGAGILLEKPDVNMLRDAVQKVLTDPAYKAAAEKIAASFKACGGAKAAAEKILKCCGKK